MFNKVELLVGAFSVIAMALALYLIQVRLDSMTGSSSTQVAQVPESRIIFVPDSKVVSQESALETAFRDAVDDNGNFSRMVIDDIKVGTGVEAKEGDSVLVHYAGTLQEGLEFDNSRQRGEPFAFTVGAGQVIKGWEEGLIGMREGGERILVIPPDKAYGEKGIGPIPGGATLVFKIELLEVKK